jgi:hypothetical protein
MTLKLSLKDLRARVAMRKQQQAVDARARRALGGASPPRTPPAPWRARVLPWRPPKDS